MDLTCELCATLVPHQDRNTRAHLHWHFPESRLLNVYQPTVPTPRQAGGEVPAALGPPSPHQYPFTPSLSTVRYPSETSVASFIY